LEDLEQKVKRMAEYLNDEAVANALKITPEAVRDILEGKATIAEKEGDEEGGPVIHVSSIKTSYRQKVISVVRTKGGVGCTVTALGLALAVSKDLRTLLINIDPDRKFSDLAYYLNLAEVLSWPEISVFKDFDRCEVKVEQNFDVLEVGDDGFVDADEVVRAITLARQNYDAIVIDTPNRAFDDFAAQALEQSNVLVAVVSGLESELMRAVSLFNRYPQKDLIVAANRCDLKGIKELEGYEIVTVDHDAGLLKSFETGDLPSDKGALMNGIKQVKNILYDQKPREGLLSRVFGGG